MPDMRTRRPTSSQDSYQRDSTPNMRRNEERTFEDFIFLRRYPQGRRDCYKNPLSDHFLTKLTEMTVRSGGKIVSWTICEVALNCRSFGLGIKDGLNRAATSLSRKGSWHSLLALLHDRPLHVELARWVASPLTPTRTASRWTQETYTTLHNYSGGARHPLSGQLCYLYNTMCYFYSRTGSSSCGLDFPYAVTKLAYTSILSRILPRFNATEECYTILWLEGILGMFAKVLHDSRRNWKHVLVVV